MNPSTLNLILLVPFALVFVCTSLRFLISGLRRGVWMALAYLGITLAVAAITIPLARLVAPAVGSLVEPLVSEYLPQELVRFLTENSDMALGLVGTVSALLLYPILFCILSLVARLVSGIFIKPLLTNRKLWSKAVGAGVGCVHALIYPIIFLLPIYGTLAAFAPTVQAVMETQDQPNREVLCYVEAVAENPVVQVARTRPLQWFYGNLSKITVGDASLNVADASVATGDILVITRNLEYASPDQQEAQLRELNAYARDRVFDEPWFYTLVVEVGLERVDGLIEDPTALQWLASLKDSSQAEFGRTMLALSDFLDVLFTDGRLEQADKIKDLLQDPVLMAELEKALQATSQTQKLRELALIQALEDYLFQGDGEASRIFVTEVLRDPGTRELFNMNTVCALVQRTERAELAEYLISHPDIDTDALTQILTKNDLLDKIRIRRSLAPDPDQ